MEESSALLALRCTKCRKVYIFPRTVCGRCGTTELERTSLPGTGKIHSHTLIRIAPTAFLHEAPYYVVVVELDEGARVAARLTGNEISEVEVGAVVSFVKRDERGHWFRLESRQKRRSDEQNLDRSE